MQTQNDINRQVSNMHPTARKMLAKALSGEARAAKWDIYHSKVRFQSAISGAGPFTYTIAAGTQMLAFGYAKGADMGPAGFVGGGGTPAAGNRTAKDCDTNIIKASETNAGEKVVIFGLSIMIDADSEPELVKQWVKNTSVVLSLNGDALIFRLGTVAMIPGAGGLSGNGQSLIALAPNDQGQQPFSGAVNNGEPFVDNFYPLPEPIEWNPAGANDSTLVVKLTTDQVCTFVTSYSADRAAAAGGASVQPVAAFAHPVPTNTFGVRGTYIDASVRLWSRQIAPRSVNQ